MGEPATPTAKDRAETRVLVWRIVDSVRNDAAMPLGLEPTSVADHAHGRCVRRSDVEQLVFQLAQEIELLAGERDSAGVDIAAARDELAEIAEGAVGDDRSLECVREAHERIAALRKIGAQ